MEIYHKIGHKAVAYWTDIFRRDAEKRTTLEFCNTSILRINQINKVWRIVTLTTADVKRANQSDNHNMYCRQTGHISTNIMSITLTRWRYVDWKLRIRYTWSALTYARTKVLHKIQLAILATTHGSSSKQVLSTYLSWLNNTCRQFNQTLHWWRVGYIHETMPPSACQKTRTTKIPTIK